MHIGRIALIFRTYGTRGKKLTRFDVIRIEIQFKIYRDKLKKCIKLVKRVTRTVKAYSLIYSPHFYH
ncbi:MAG: hypothetical protein QXP55_03500 [Nitrososphaerales archaeon]